MVHDRHQTVIAGADPDRGSRISAVSVQGGSASIRATVPPARRTSSCTMASPSPDPPEPRPAVVARRGIIESGESLEHPLSILLGHPRTVVGHQQPHLLLIDSH